MKFGRNSTTEKSASIPTTTLLEHTLLTRGFTGVAKAAFPCRLRRKTAILRGQIWSTHSSDVVGIRSCEISFQMTIDSLERLIDRLVSRKGFAGWKHNLLFSKDFKIWFDRPAR